MVSLILALLPIAVTYEVKVSKSLIVFVFIKHNYREKKNLVKNKFVLLILFVLFCLYYVFYVYLTK